MLSLTKFIEKINNSYDEKLASLDTLKYSIITNSFYAVDFNALFNKIGQT
jgi:hypothetical protein